MLKTMMICIGLVGLPHVAAAQSVQDQVVTQLQAQGFKGIEVQRTFLGRLRFTAESSSFYRELVINPQTGEVLRDYVRDLEDVNNRDRAPRILNPNSRQNDTNDDDTSDDYKDDDDDDDKNDDKEDEDDDQDDDEDDDGDDSDDEKDEEDEEDD
jgi:hypothetical protein